MVGWSVGGWSDGRMVGGRAVRWPVGQVVRWSRVFEWLNGRLIGCRTGHKQKREQDLKCDCSVK